MRFAFLLLVLVSTLEGWSQYQPWKNIEPGVYQFRGLFPPLRNTFLVEVGKDGYFLINTPFNSPDQAAMMNSIRTDFPGKQLKALFVLENDYASAAGAFLVTSALGKVPIYSASNLDFSEEEKQAYLSKNPKNQEAGKLPPPLSSNKSFAFQFGKLTLKSFGGTCGEPSFYISVQPSGTLFGPTKWLEMPFPISNSWTYKSMISNYQQLLSQNPSRIFGGLSSEPFPKYRVWEMLRNWEAWKADYDERKKEKMTLEEFRKSMEQRKNLYPWVPNGEKSLEILWKIGLKAL
jgi:hypothetical protein